MKTSLLLLALLLICAICSFGQTADTPKYFLAAGLGTTPYVLPNGSGFLTFGLHLGGSNYTYSHMILTREQATVSQGFMRVLIVQDGFTLGLLGDAGIAAGADVAASIAAGGILSYDISRFTKIPKTSIVGAVKAQKLTGSAVSPTFSIGFAKSF